MDELIDTLDLTADCEVVNSRLLDGIPIITEDTRVIRVGIPRDSSDVAHDRSTSITFLLISPALISQVLSASLFKSSDLWHVVFIQNIQSFWKHVHVCTLSDWGCVRITAHSRFKVKVG